MLILVKNVICGLKSFLYMHTISFDVQKLFSEKGKILRAYARAKIGIFAILLKNWKNGSYEVHAESQQILNTKSIDPK